MSKNMYRWLKDLFPLCRSITGLGTKKTLSYFEKINPELKSISFKTGKKVFDWEIPKEWNVKNAYIQHESGKKFAEFSKSNLHIVNYSVPINKTISKSKLLPHLHTKISQPNVVPYVTSYYENYWGFCISEKEKKRLPNGKYKIFIDSQLKKGSLNISHALIKGKSKKEIFFSTYICHPSMANDNLSGPVLLNGILQFIKNEFKNLKFSYRFVLVPETIGSIAFLSKFHKTIKKNMIAGFNLSCVGDERAYSHIKSKRENTLADDALSAALIGLKNVKTYSYLYRGSDERQYCSPGIDLPVCGFTKSRYGAFPEYHTDADNLKLVTKKGLEDSLLVFKNIITAFEEGLYPTTKILCEPQLIKRKLSPSISHVKSFGWDNNTAKLSYDKLRLRKDLLSYADGTKNIFQISKIINKPLSLINYEHKLLKSHGIIKNN